jgi:purine-binding chemotaxis protein CheW
MANLARRDSRGMSHPHQSPDHRGPLTEYLGFRLAADPFAAPVALIREILKPGVITPVPRAPREVLGITSVRGLLVTVVDLRRRLHLPEEAVTRRSRILLVDSGVETLGLFVDEVLQVYRLADEEIELAAPVLGGDVAEYISGIARPSPSAAEFRRARMRSARRTVPTSEHGGQETDDDGPPVVTLLDLRGVLS